MKYREIKAQCEGVGAVKRNDPSGDDTCAFSGGICNGYNCPSKQYWNESHRQPGWHRMRSLEKTGLEGQFAEEILNEER